MDKRWEKHLEPGEERGIEKELDQWYFPSIYFNLLLPGKGRTNCQRLTEDIHIFPVLRELSTEGLSTIEFGERCRSVVILYERWLPLSRLLLLVPGVTSTRKHLLVPEAMVRNARYGFCSCNLHTGMISMSPTWSNTKLYGIQMNHIGSYKTPDSKYYLPSIKQMFVSKLQSPLIGWHCAA